MTTVRELVRKALEPFAKQANEPFQLSGLDGGRRYVLVHSLADDLVRARAALVALDAVPEGMETTFEERAMWCDVSRWTPEVRAVITALCCDVDRLLLEREAVAKSEQQVADAYQIVASLADHAGLHDHPEVVRALDYLAYGKCAGDILPWPKEPLPQADIAAAVAAENEACAHMISGFVPDRTSDLRTQMAAAIRSRRKAPPLRAARNVDWDKDPR